VLGLDALDYSTLVPFLRQSQRIHIPMETAETPPTTVLDDATLNALKQRPFCSVIKLAKLTCIPRSTVPRHLTRTLGFVVKHLRSVSHNFAAAQKASRVTLANQLFQDLCAIKHQGSQFIVTLDES
jgi:hypothetical protein